MNWAIEKLLEPQPLTCSGTVTLRLATENALRMTWLDLPAKTPWHTTSINLPISEFRVLADLRVALIETIQRTAESNSLVFTSNDLNSKLFELTQFLQYQNSSSDMKVLCHPDDAKVLSKSSMQFGDVEIFVHTHMKQGELIGLPSSPMTGVLLQRVMMGKIEAAWVVFGNMVLGRDPTPSRWRRLLSV